MATLFRENGIDFKSVNYFNEPLTGSQLEALFAKIGLEPFEMLRKADPAFKANSITAEMPPETIIKLIAENPGLLQRPIVEVGDSAVVARPIDKALELIK